MRRKGNKGAEPILSPLNDEMQPERDLTAERNAEVIPIAREIIRAMGEAADKLPIGDPPTDPEKVDEYARFYRDMFVNATVVSLIKHNPKMKDISYVFRLVFQPFQNLQDVTIASFNMNRDVADAKLWGVKDIDDVRVGDVDRVLKGDEGGDNAPADAGAERIVKEEGNAAA